MEAAHPVLAIALPSAEYQVSWFMEFGCVVDHGDRCDVLIGGRLLGEFARSDRDRGPRNVLAVMLSRDPRVHFGRLASAFGMTDEYLRQLRRKAEQYGLGAVLIRRGVGRRKTTAGQRRRMWELFETGASAADVHRQQGRRGRVSESTIKRERMRWLAEKADKAAPSSAATPRAQQLALPGFVPASADPDDSGTGGAAPDEGEGDPIAHLRPAPVASGGMVQHLGCWLLLAGANQHGLPAAAAEVLGQREGGEQLRIVLDAVLCALAIGQRCVEGVRRLATSSAPLLLRANRPPSASWARRVLHGLAEDAGGERLHGLVGAHYLGELEPDAAIPSVFYVDNHLRRYTGMYVLRKGWRMQDRRVVPGATDYYVHDEDGRPVFRTTAPSHDSLTEWLLAIGQKLRAGVGERERILLAFDRAGAYAEQLARVRDAGFELVTYERRPYPTLPASAFDRTVVIDGEVYGLHESRERNLGKGRGRVRRIALRTPDGRQVNVLAVSAAPAAELIQILTGRWCQENGLKHGVERWGINQLDGRSLEAYPPDTIIPNPARRRLDHALRLARVEEGLLRNKLADGALAQSLRQRLEQDLEIAVRSRVELEILRPFLPRRAPLHETDLAGKLVKHDVHYKAALDAIRIVAANVESELAADLAPHLPRPAEAKKSLATLFAAPGAIAVRDDHIRVVLSPAGTARERGAYDALLQMVNRRRMSLPGDPARRPLRFQVL